MLEINRLAVETTNAKSDLCNLGAVFGTDKSPYNTTAAHRHPYTAVYDLLFSGIRHAPIRFGEVGILDNASMKMWRSYFSRAKLYGFEYSPALIEAAQQHGLANVFYDQADVSCKASLQRAFQKAGGRFDILIDDSTHLFDHQINFISSALEFINPGGFLIVEDIFNGWDENLYRDSLQPFSNFIESATFLVPDHKLKYSEGMPEPYYDNDKVLLIRRNSVDYCCEKGALFENTRLPLTVFVVTHKEVFKPLDESYFLIQAGSLSGCIEGILHDNTGDNISDRNAIYSELTAHYWIWKNVKCEYVALMHYRRFLTARKETFEYQGYNVSSAADLLEELKDVDIVTSLPFVFLHYGTNLPESVEQHYVRHHGFEFLTARQILAAVQPDYVDAFEVVMRNNLLYGNNIMAMKKSVFDQYCQWAFPLFFEIEKVIQIRGFDKYQSRFIAFLSERLFSVWIVHNRKSYGVAHRNMILLENA